MSELEDIGVRALEKRIVALEQAVAGLEQFAGGIRDGYVFVSYRDPEFDGAIRSNVDVGQWVANEVYRLRNAIADIRKTKTS